MINIEQINSTMFHDRILITATTDMTIMEQVIKGPLEGYAAGQGSDLIEISSGLQTALQNKGMIFLGGQGDDSILYANFADGGQGNDTLFASNVESAYDYYTYKAYDNHRVNHGFLSEERSNVLFGADGDDTFKAISTMIF